MDHLIGAFDIDLALADEALNCANSPTRRMLANAALGTNPVQACLTVSALRLFVKRIYLEGGSVSMATQQILARNDDDFAKCVYYCLAGRGVKNMLADLSWLDDLLKARSKMVNQIMHLDNYKEPVSPYVDKAAGTGA